MRVPLISLCLGILALAACREAARTPGAAPAGSPESASAAGPPSPGSANTITGPVLEAMNASSYTYVRVGTPSGDVWAASQQFPVKVGDRVTVPLETPMQGFHSASLNRDFPLIYFASRITVEGAAAAAPSPARGGMMASHGSAATAAEPIEPMAPPAGGMSIADIWKNRQALAGKSVTVHGKVVKFNGGIMGRNWLHLQDGTGSAADGTNDLAVTTSDEVKVGDVVTLTGIVGIDKDFTAGYAYAVIVESAKVNR